MIPKTPTDLNNYIRDGGDPDRISIQPDPVQQKPTPSHNIDNEGRHYYGGYYHYSGRTAD